MIHPRARAMAPPAAAALCSPTAALLIHKNHTNTRTFTSKPAPAAAPRRCFISSSSLSYTTPSFFFHELGLSEDQTHHLLQSHPQLESQSRDSLHDSISKLRSLKMTHLAISRTVARRPEVLTSPGISSLLDFIREEIDGLVPDKLERLLLLSAHPQLFAIFSSRIQLLVERGIPKDKVGHVLNNVHVGRVFVEMPLRDFEEMLIFLQRFRWPDIVLRRPAILNLDLRAQLIPRVGVLTGLAGGDEAAAAFLIGKLPAILAYTVEHFKSHLEFWRSVGLTREQVFKIALVYPNVFSVSRDPKLKLRVEFLTDCGLNAEDIFKFLIKAPVFLSLSFEKNLSKKLTFLIKIGYRYRTRELAAAVGAATRTSCENLQMVVGVFMSYGFSCDDLLTMSKKHPQILQYNCESLEKKMEFLVEEMERDIGELMAFPAFLGYKLDDRIKHRYEVKKESRGKAMSLNKLLSVSTKRFNSKK